MKLYYPTINHKVNQKFGQNATSYYREDGLKGHTGCDLHCTHGETIFSATDGYVYSVLNKDNPDLMRYRAVYVLYEQGDEIYEISYGHATDILVKAGDTVTVGTRLMTGGNTGDVASGGKKITRAEKEAGSTRGTHLHFQIRPLIKSKNRRAHPNPIYDGQGLLKLNNYYYFVKNRENGYAGCVDPQPFFAGLYAYENKPKVTDSMFKVLVELLTKIRKTK